MIPLNGNRTKPPLAFINESGEVIPKFAVIKITDAETTDDRDLKADKPDGDSTDCTFALNLDRAVAADRSGTCTNVYAAWALYDDANTPQPGEEWGPDDDWLLHKGKKGYVIVGGAEDFEVGETTYSRVRVQVATGGSSLQWGEATSTISAATAWGTPGSATVQFKDDAGANDGSPVSVANWFWDSFDNKSIVCCDRKFDPPRIVSVGCTAAT